MPKPQVLESLTFRLNAVGFVLWTFTVMSGAMWAEHAWGRYWGWDPKEVWSFVIWIIYAAYLHARTTQGWAGRRAAWLAISGLHRDRAELHRREPVCAGAALVLGAEVSLSTRFGVCGPAIGSLS